MIQADTLKPLQCIESKPSRSPSPTNACALRLKKTDTCAQALPHLATVEDVANAILFLASDQAAAISGSNVLIDGAAMTGIGGESLITKQQPLWNSI